MIYTCCDEKRRDAVDSHLTLSGIDWLEVLDLDAPAGSPRQRTLMIRLLKPVPAGLGTDNVRIRGGQRVRSIALEWVAPASAPPPEANAAEQAFFAGLTEPDHVLLVRTKSDGDYSRYTLRLQKGEDDESPLQDFDPRLSTVSFSFKVECPSDFDCKPEDQCAEAPHLPLDIDYLAKDYGSFRRLMLDRLSGLVPDWRERTAADLGVALTELLAYTGDHLSYWQDAVGTEAYLDTARRRTSLRRHALLVDYHMHDGCNARTWVQVRVQGGPVPLPKGTRFYTRAAGAPATFDADSAEQREALQRSPPPRAFESMHDATLFDAHNRMPFYTWGDERCCLPKGAVRATLLGHFPKLAKGDVLVFVEVKGPHTGRPEDADPTRRHAVRLTAVRAFDTVGSLRDPLNQEQITEISWGSRDALPFPVCVSSQSDGEHGRALIEEVSEVLGNIVLADHGATIRDAESLGSVPAPHLHVAPDRDASPCNQGQRIPVPPRFNPRLAEAPLTQTGTVLRVTSSADVKVSERVTFDPASAAADAMRWRLSDVVPAIGLNSSFGSATGAWEPRRDLLSCESSDECFVVETEHDGSASLRFGDDVHGQRPDAGTSFQAVYRIGNGKAGNVGANAVAHVETSDGRITGTTNPMPAVGGHEPESTAQVRRRAPEAFRTQERAVTPEDYAAVTERFTDVQRAAGSLRWTGSWHTVFVTVDREGGDLLDREYVAPLTRHVDRFRMAGHDLHFDDPRFVSLEIDMKVCVARGYFRSDVRSALLEVFSSGVRPDGRSGLFHPDNFSFGQTVYLSPLYAAARSVAGVDSVEVTRFHRQGQPDTKPAADGFMKLNRLEIARLANNPNFPEHGVLRLELSGGK